MKKDREPGLTIEHPGPRTLDLGSDMLDQGLVFILRTDWVFFARKIYGRWKYLLLYFTSAQ